ncbi:MAG TPA: MFS transporter [Mycobacteriales bacterium]|jgi:MFS family permease|nr:MFS transporter [Mycobacteriales bacterium]
MWESLRVRNYRLFASGQVVSLTGTWMQRVAQDWLVVELAGPGHRGIAVGVTTGLQFAPTLLLSLYGGVLADRHRKRRLLVLTQAASMLAALVLGVLVVTGAVQLWHVYALAFALGLATSIDSPTRQAFVSELVGPDLVANAVSLNSATFNIARILGTAAGGFLIKFVGTGAVFLINAGTFLAVISSLLLIREADLMLGKRLARRAGQLREGLAYVRRRPDLLLPIVLVGVVGTFGFNFQLTMALIAKGTFHKDAASYGLLSTAIAVGSLGGALLAARRERPRQSLLVGSALVFGALEIADGFMPSYAALIILLIPTGVAALTFTTAANSTVQLGSSPQMRGRVMALYVMVFLGGTPIGAPLIGWLAGVLGPRYGLIIGGAVCTAVAGAIAAMLLRLRMAQQPTRSVQPVYDEVRTTT